MSTFGKISTLLGQLGSALKTSFENTLALSVTDLSRVERVKVATLLEKFNFDVNQKNLNILKNFHSEDILILKHLHETNNVAWAKFYDGETSCFSKEHNIGKIISQLYFEGNFYVSKYPPSIPNSPFL